MFDLLGIRPDQYFAAKFIPFRSVDWQRLENKVEAVEFAERLWGWALTKTPARLFLCLGNEAAAGIAGLLHAKETESYSSNYGNGRIARLLTEEGGSPRKVVVRIPHLSRFQLFGRANHASDMAVEALLSAWRPA